MSKKGLTFTRGCMKHSYEWKSNKSMYLKCDKGEKYATTDELREAVSSENFKNTTALRHRSFLRIK